LAFPFYVGYEPIYKNVYSTHLLQGYAFIKESLAISGWHLHRSIGKPLSPLQIVDTMNSQKP
jgi:hypothetical protein